MLQSLDDSVSTADGRKVCSYAAASKEFGCLTYSSTLGGYHMFERNERWNCMNACKNSVVQRGRSVPLEGFR